MREERGGKGKGGWENREVRRERGRRRKGREVGVSGSQLEEIFSLGYLICDVTIYILVTRF
jgi:hypothetical protein